MFERFTDRARRVTVLAQEEARMLSHNYIGTEHILLGLIHEGEGVASRALAALDISLEGVRSQVEAIIGIGNETPHGHIPFTPRAKKVLELSLREALQLGHNYIGTEHILLGLIREGEGVAAQVLVRLGCELTVARQEVIKLLVGYQGKVDAADSAPVIGGGGGGTLPFGNISVPNVHVQDPPTHVQQVLLKELQAIEDKIVQCEVERTRLQAARDEVIQHLSPPAPSEQAEAS